VPDIIIAITLLSEVYVLTLASVNQVSPTIQDMRSAITWTSYKPHTFHTPNTGAYLPQTIFLLRILQQHIINFPCNIFIYVVQSQWLQQKQNHSFNNKIIYKVLVSEYTA